MNVARKIKAITAGLCLAGAVEAENFMRGVRGPTDWQFDTRATVSKRELNGKETTSITDTASIRYWNGGSKGVFGYVVAPYRFVDSGSAQRDGLGDISLGFGPRGALTNGIGSFHIISTFGLILPTGDEKVNPRLGNGRTDMRFSIGGTYLTLPKTTEVDMSFDYIRSEKSASDDILLGFAAGRQIHPSIKIGLGLIANVKNGGLQDGNYLITGRAIMRYTPQRAKNSEDQWKKNWHTELWFDRDITSRNLPKGFSGTLVWRYNF